MNPTITQLTEKMVCKQTCNNCKLQLYKCTLKNCITNLLIEYLTNHRTTLQQKYPLYDKGIHQAKITTLNELIQKLTQETQT